MTPTEYVRVFARWWWLVVLCVVLGTALSFLVGGLASPTYVAAANVYVSSVRTRTTTPTDAVQGTVLAQQRVGSYADIARGQAFAQSVIDDLGLALTPSELQQRTDVVVPAQTSLLRISVHDTDPEQAHSIAAATATAITATVTDLERSRGLGKPQLRARVIGGDEVPTDPIPPPAWRNPLLGGFGGLVVGLGLAVVLSRLDRRVRDESTAREVLGAPVLGVLPIPGRRRPGRSGQRWAEAVRELRTSVFFLHPGDDRCLTIVLTSPSPSERVSQVAGEVATALVDAGSRVLLVEGDLHEPHRTPLLDPTTAALPGLADYLASTCSAEEVIHHHEISGVDVVPGGSAPEHPEDLLHQHAFATLLQKAAQHYDFVLVTAAAASLGTDAAAVAARCDGAVVVLTSGTTTRVQVRSALRQLQRVDARVLGGVLLV